MDLFLTKIQEEVNRWKCNSTFLQINLHPGWPEGEYIFSYFSFWGELFL